MKYGFELMFELIFLECDNVIDKHKLELPVLERLPYGASKPGKKVWVPANSTG